MIDRIFIGNTPQTETLFRPDYRPDEVMLSDEVINEAGKNLIALFHPWHGGGPAYDFLTKRLVRSGNAVLNLVFDDQQLTHNAEQTLESFQTLAVKSAGRLQELASSGRYDRFHLFAASLGVPALAMTTSLFDGFDHATMITPGDNLADCARRGIRTQRLWKELERSGKSYSEIDQIWQPIAPVNHTAALVDKRVSIVVSTSDAVIPAMNQVKYVKALQAGGVHPEISSYRHGHYGTILRHCLIGSMS